MNALAARSTSVIVRSLLLGLSVSIALAACSSGGAPSAPTSGGAGDGGPIAAPQTASNGTTGPAGAIDVCAVVTAADAASVFTGPVTATTEPGLVGSAAGCDYVANQDRTPRACRSRSSGATRRRRTGPATSRPRARTASRSPASATRRCAPQGPPISSRSRAPSSVRSRPGQGNTEIYTGLATPDASDNVPDDSATAFAEKMGQLCDRIFASAEG